MLLMVNDMGVVIYNSSLVCNRLYRQVERERGFKLKQGVIYEDSLVVHNTVWRCARSRVP